MNIDLAGASSKAKKKKLNMGLNQRGGGGSSNTGVFGDDTGSSSDEDNRHASSSRAAVNQALKREQEALRKRAQDAASQEAIYDYDGAYDSFHAKPSQPQQDEDRKSRYIGDLLKASEKRKRESDVIYERKVAREQAAEDAEADYRGKDKFVTSAYKRKLAERELWLEEEEKQQREEEANDVTKKTDGTAMASFYGNLNRNVAMGATQTETVADNKTEMSLKEADVEASRLVPESDTVARNKRDFTGGFEKSKSNAGDNTMETKDETQSEQVSQDPATRKQRIRELREQKVKEARVRYFQRHGVTAA